MTDGNGRNSPVCNVSDTIVPTQQDWMILTGAVAAMTLSFIRATHWLADVHETVAAMDFVIIIIIAVFFFVIIIIVLDRIGSFQRPEIVHPFVLIILACRYTKNGCSSVVVGKCCNHGIIVVGFIVRFFVLLSLVLQ